MRAVSSGGSGTFRFPASSASDPWILLDGRLNAPSGAPQHPNLLTGNGTNTYAVRPPWKVAGVDYRVGINTGVTLTNWESVTGPGISISGNLLRVDNTSGVVFDGIDFTTGHGASQNGVIYLVSSPNAVIRNCLFSNRGSALAEVNDGDGNSPGASVTYCEFHGDGGTNTESGCIGLGGATVVQYNWFKFYAAHVIETGGVDLDYRFNLIEDGAVGAADVHLNTLQLTGTGGVTTARANVKFNCMLQNQQIGRGEGFQFYFNGGGTIINPVLSNNVMIAPPCIGTNVSFFVHGSNETGTTLSGAGTASQNYFDLSSAGSFYPGSMTGWTISGNLNLIDGTAVT